MARRWSGAAAGSGWVAASAGGGSKGSEKGGEQVPLRGQGGERGWPDGSMRGWGKALGVQEAEGLVIGGGGHGVRTLTRKGPI